VQLPDAGPAPVIQRIAPGPTAVAVTSANLNGIAEKSAAYVGVAGPESVLVASVHVESGDAPAAIILLRQICTFVLTLGGVSV
jgi:hypothetical protein